MKKLFLFYIGVLFSINANANTIYETEKLSVNLDGNIAGYYVYNAAAENDDDNKFEAYGEINLDTEYYIDNENSAGIYFSLISNPYDNSYKPLDVIGETYFYTQGSYGRFELGRAKNISSKMHISTPDVGLLNINGSYGLDYILSSSGFNYISSTEIDTDKEAAKISYISPSFNGFQFGLSYIPNTGEGDNSTNLDYDKFEKGFTSSLKYKKQSDDTFAVSLSYARFDNTQMPISFALKREEYSAGIMYYHKGWQFSSSYKNIKEEGILNTISQDGYAFDYGIAYEIGPLELSLMNYTSNVDSLISLNGDDKLNISSLSGKLNVKEWLDFGLSLGRISYETENNLKNLGALVTTGFVINF